MRPGRTLTVLMLALPALSAFHPAQAPAATTIGQIGTSTYCVEDRAHFQQGIFSGRSYTAAARGLITSWYTPATPEPGHTLQLLIARRDFPVGGLEHNFTVARKDVVRPLSATGLNWFRGLRIPIEAGEEPGLYVPAGQPVVTFMGITAPAGVCLFATGSLTDQYRTHDGDPPTGARIDYNSSGTGYRLNAGVIVEPDADRDGFGDESQDGCPSDASTQGPCPEPPPAARAPIKKCKRGKHYKRVRGKLRCVRKKEKRKRR